MRPEMMKCTRGLAQNLVAGLRSFCDRNLCQMLPSFIKDYDDAAGATSQKEGEAAKKSCTRIYSFQLKFN